MLISNALIYDVFLQSMSLWWVIVPGMLLGIIVGILPGFSAQNTLIILLPLTLAYLQWFIIPLEESKLRDAFGPAFDSYRATVRRWI